MGDDHRLDWNRWFSLQFQFRLLDFQWIFYQKTICSSQECGWSERVKWLSSPPPILILFLRPQQAFLTAFLWEYQKVFFFLSWHTRTKKHLKVTKSALDLFWPWEYILKNSGFSDLILRILMKIMNNIHISSFLFSWLVRVIEKPQNEQNLTRSSTQTWFCVSFFHPHLLDLFFCMQNFLPPSFFFRVLSLPSMPISFVLWDGNPLRHF